MAIEDKGELYFVSVPVVSVFADIYDDSERETQVLLGEPVYVLNETTDGLWKEVIVPNQYREPEGGTLLSGLHMRNFTTCFYK